MLVKATGLNLGFDLDGNGPENQILRLIAGEPESRDRNEPLLIPAVGLHHESLAAPQVADEPPLIGVAVDSHPLAASQAGKNAVGRRAVEVGSHRKFSVRVSCVVCLMSVLHHDYTTEQTRVKSDDGIFI